jgi:hypothetical protein
MNKEEYIGRYGEVAYKKYRESNRIWMNKWHTTHVDEARKRGVQWKVSNPNKVKAHDQEISHKGGKYYDKALIRATTGVSGEKHKIRNKDNRIYKPFKDFVDPSGLTHLHHEWLNNGTSNYRGVALVEADQHMRGFIDVIQILEGEITLLTEREIKGE